MLKPAQAESDDTGDLLFRKGNASPSARAPQRAAAASRGASGLTAGDILSAKGAAGAEGLARSFRRYDHKEILEVEQPPEAGRSPDMEEPDGSWYKYDGAAPKPAAALFELDENAPTNWYKYEPDPPAPAVAKSNLAAAASLSINGFARRSATPPPAPEPPQEAVLAEEDFEAEASEEISEAVGSPARALQEQLARALVIPDADEDAARDFADESTLQENWGTALAESTVEAPPAPPQPLPTMDAAAVAVFLLEQAMRADWASALSASGGETPEPPPAPLPALDAGQAREFERGRGQTETWESALSGSIGETAEAPVALLPDAEDISAGERALWEAWTVALSSSMGETPETPIRPLPAAEDFPAGTRALAELWHDALAGSAGETPEPHILPVPAAEDTLAGERALSEAWETALANSAGENFELEVASVSVAEHSATVESAKAESGETVVAAPVDLSPAPQPSPLVTESQEFAAAMVEAVALLPPPLPAAEDASAGERTRAETWELALAGSAGETAEPRTAPLPAAEDISAVERRMMDAWQLALASSAGETPEPPVTPLPAAEDASAVAQSRRAAWEFALACSAGETPEPALAPLAAAQDSLAVEREAAEAWRFAFACSAGETAELPVSGLPAAEGASAVEREAAEVWASALACSAGETPEPQIVPLPLPEDAAAVERATADAWEFTLAGSAGEAPDALDPVAEDSSVGDLAGAEIQDSISTGTAIEAVEPLLLTDVVEPLLLTDVVEPLLLTDVVDRSVVESETPEPTIEPLLEGAAVAADVLVLSAEMALARIDGETEVTLRHEPLAPTGEMVPTEDILVLTPEMAQETLEPERRSPPLAEPREAAEIDHAPEIASTEEARAEAAVSPEPPVKAPAVELSAVKSEIVFATEEPPRLPAPLPRGIRIYRGAPAPGIHKGSGADMGANTELADGIAAMIGDMLNTTEFATQASAKARQAERLAPLEPSPSTEAFDQAVAEALGRNSAPPPKRRGTVDRALAVMLVAMLGAGGYFGYSLYSREPSAPQASVDAVATAAAPALVPSASAVAPAEPAAPVEPRNPLPKDPRAKRAK